MVESPKFSGSNGSKLPKRHQIEPNEELNHITCGHAFHKTCLEKWLMRWNISCPLSRSRIVPQDVEDIDRVLIQ
ncbi:hypothetical protein ACSBR2_027855 [Camellia fascicularis]